MAEQKITTPQQTAQDALLNVLGVLAGAEPGTVDENTARMMVSKCIFEVLANCYGHSIEKYASSAITTIRRLLLKVKNCPVKFSDVELKRLVAQYSIALCRGESEREKIIAAGGDPMDTRSIKQWRGVLDKTLDIASGMVRPEDDPDSPTNRLGELSAYIRTWADFPAFGFGIPKLDEATGGILPGEICVLTGAPGTMKTSLALSAVDDFVTRTQKGLVYYCTVDMSPRELSMRLVERENGIPEAQVRMLAGSNDSRDREQYAVMWQRVARKYNGRLAIKGHEPKQRMNIQALRQECLIRQPQLVIVDYFTCLKELGQSDLEYVETAMPLIVSFAHEYETSFLLLSQMSRSSRSEQASGRMGGHGKGGGIVEELAHTEIELTQQPNTDNRPPLVIAAVTKARRGISGQYFSLDYNGPIKKFTGTAQRVVKAKNAQRTLFELEGGFYDGFM